MLVGLVAATAWWTALKRRDGGSAGPSRGWLIAAGGGVLDDSIWERFVELAGGPEALIVIIPTASAREEFGDDWPGLEPFRRRGCRRLKILHTRDRQTADSEEFTAPLREAGGVWFGGGRQWRLVDAYLDTRTAAELRNLLARGGVVGGTSAGATILGSYLVRGAPEGNHILMAPGYETGFGFLRAATIDQHLLARQREFDLVEVIRDHPELLGIGLDEGSAIAVHGDRFEVLGVSNVAIYEHDYIENSAGAPFYFLSVGNRFDLGKRRPVAGPP